MDADKKNGDMLGEVQYSATQTADVLTMQNFQINFPQDFGNWRFPQDWWIQRKSSLRNSTVWNPQLLPTAALL